VFSAPEVSAVAAATCSAQCLMASHRLTVPTRGLFPAFTVHVHVVLMGAR
jgi:hypothetical protein